MAPRSQATAKASGRATRGVPQADTVSARKDMPFAEDIPFADDMPFAKDMAFAESMPSPTRATARSSALPTRFVRRDGREVTGDDVLAIARPHIGEVYKLGARAPMANSGWTGPWDCAEFVSWCVYQASGILFGTQPRNDPVRADAFTGFWAEQTREAGCSAAWRISVLRPERRTASMGRKPRMPSSSSRPIATWWWMARSVRTHSKP